MADVALSAGWTWDDTLETLTMTRLRALNRHWERHPPAHKMVAGFCGYKAPQKPAEIARASDDPSGIGGLIALYPSGFVPAQR